MVEVCFLKETQVPGIIQAVRKGEILSLPDDAAERFIALGNATLLGFRGEPEPVSVSPDTIQEREPTIEDRDPKPKRKKK